MDKLNLVKFILHNPFSTCGTKELLRQNAVVGLQAQFDRKGNIERIGITCALCHSTVANAQSPVHLGVGGVTFPQDGDAGWNALATVALTTLMQPIGLRADIGYNQFDIGSAPANGEKKVISVTANVTYRLPMTNSPLSPYVIAGGGWYKQDCSAPATCAESTLFGWNGGAGTKLNLMGIVTFAEARYHGARNGRFTALTAGLFF
jgi:hypothetical protein